MKQFLTILVLAILVGCTPFLASAQFDLTTALRKYWKTRGRLVGDEYNRNRYNGFLVVGDQPGMSIPAEQRGKNKYGREINVKSIHIQGNYLPGAECGKQLQNTNNPPIDPRDGQVESGQITWGDGTIQLAHYLIALGYEHALMRRAGDPEIWRTERELYYALKALKRLDIWGESYIPAYNIGAAHENGFFVRDDVPKDFALRHMGADYDIVKSDRSCGGVPDYNNELSYDQYIAVMLGLRMVYHLVPYNASYNNERLIDIVRDISKKASDRVLNLPLGIIFQPSNNMFDNNGSTVRRGAYVPFAAYPMALCATEIAGWPTGNASWPTLYQHGYVNWFSRAVYNTLKTGLALDQAANYVVTARQLTASGLVNIRTARATFGREASFDNHNDNINMMLQCMVASRKATVDWTPWNPWLLWTRYTDLSGAKTVKDISSRYKKAVYQLFGSTLCGWPYSDKGNYDFWESEFNKYPCCGPCVYETQYDAREVDNEGCVNVESTPTGTPPRSPGSLAGDPDWAIAHPWTTTNRWEHWGRDHKPVVYREYAGVDFLESFGAYLYKMRSGTGLFQNLRVDLFLDFPRTVNLLRGPYTYGNVPNPFYGRAVFSMRVKGFYAGEVDGQERRARAALRAGSNIDFIPGFYGQWGILLDAQIAPFDCDPQPKIFGPGNEMLRSAGGEEGGSGDTAMMDDAWLEYITGGYDTSAVPFEDPVFMPTTDTVREQFEDSTLIRKYMNAEQDTMYIELDSCWAFNDSNELVNICDPQNRPLSTQALALKAVKVYPTPAKNELFLEINNPSSGSLAIGIFDMMGRNLTEACTGPMRTLTAGEQVLKINTQALPAGNYTLRLILGTGQDIRKFTISR